MTLLVRRTVAIATAAIVLLAGALVGVAPASAATTGPTQVTDAPSHSYSYVEYNGLLYLAAVAEGDVYASLFSYDGTSFVSVPGSPHGINALTVFDGKLIVTAVDDIDNPPFDFVMLSFDGSTFTPIPGGFVSPNDYVEAGGVLFFQADVSGTWGVWQYDGSVASAVPGAAGVSPSSLSSYGDKLYFNGDADPSPAENNTLFSYDPATAAPAAPVAGAPSEPGELVAFDGLAYFGTDTGVYTFDGVATFAAVSIAPSTSAGGLTVFDGALYFTGFDGTTYATYVYSGGTTTLVPGGVTSETSDYVEYNGDLYFLGFGPDGGLPALAVIRGGVASMVPGSPAYTFDLTVFQGKLYFSADVAGDQAIGMFVLETTTDPALANTGVDLAAPGLIALLLLVLGAAAVLAARRRAV